MKIFRLSRLDRVSAQSGGAVRWLLLSALLLCSLVTGAAGPVSAGAADGDVTQITEAPDLNWGFKLSWRVYAGVPAVSGEASIVPDGSAASHNLGWAFDAGSYDAVTGTTVLSYRGSARWTSHGAGEVSPPPGYDGPMDIALLDVKITDPTITISADKATITAETVSRSGMTWKMVDYGRIPLVNLAADQVSPSVTAGTTSWQAIPAVIDAAASAPFGDSYYRPGISVDPVSFSYAVRAGPRTSPKTSTPRGRSGSRPMVRTSCCCRQRRRSPTIDFSPRIQPATSLTTAAPRASRHSTCRACRRSASR